MTFRQRLLSVYAGQRPDVMPWFSDLTYWYGAQQRQGILPPEYDGDEGFVKLHVDHHVGYYLGYAPVYADSFENVKVFGETEGNTTRTCWRTPVGEMWNEERYLPETFSGAPVKWAVTTPEDLRVLRYVADATHTTPTYDRYEQLVAICGEQGWPTVLPPRSPVSQMLAQWTGAVNLTYLLADAREEVEKTFEALGRAADGAYEAIVGCDTPFVELPDNLSGEVVTPFFKRYQFDYYLRRLEQLHAVGKTVGTHLDGTMKGILPLLVATGLDFIESITPKPTGDVAIEDLRDLAGPDIILFGGIPGAMFAPPFGRDDIRRQVEKVIECEWERGKFILGSADQVPPNGDIDLVTYVGELVEELCG
jgi:hypothetical protein